MSRTLFAASLCVGTALGTAACASSTTEAPASPSATPSSSSSAGSHVKDVVWFTTTTVIPYGADWSIYGHGPEVLNNCAPSCGFGHEGHVTYRGPGSGPLAPVIDISGPVSADSVGLLPAVGAKVSSNHCAGSTPKTGGDVVGGERALGYECTDSQGRSVALAVWVHDKFAFEALFTSDPSTFKKYVSVFEEAYRSFKFNSMCDPAHAC